MHIILLYNAYFWLNLTAVFVMHYESEKKKQNYFTFEHKKYSTNLKFKFKN